MKNALNPGQGSRGSQTGAMGDGPLTTKGYISHGPRDLPAPPLGNLWEVKQRLYQICPIKEMHSAVLYLLPAPFSFHSLIKSRRGLLPTAVSALAFVKCISQLSLPRGHEHTHCSHTAAGKGAQAFLGLAVAHALGRSVPCPPELTLDHCSTHTHLAVVLGTQGQCPWDGPGPWNSPLWLQPVLSQGPSSDLSYRVLFTLCKAIMMCLSLGKQILCPVGPGPCARHWCWVPKVWRRG